MTRSSVDTLYKTDAEIAALLGLPTDEWKATAVVLERKGLPAGDPLFKDRRYFPAVRAFLDRRAGIGQDAPLAPDGQEDLGYVRTGKRTRA